MTFLYEVQHVVTAWASVVGAGRHPDRAVCYTWYARGPRLGTPGPQSTSKIGTLSGD